MTFVEAYVVNGVRYAFPHLCPNAGKCAIARWVAWKYSREYFRGESLSDFRENAGQFAEVGGQLSRSRATLEASPDS